jgi:hypothetical protein
LAVKAVYKGSDVSRATNQFSVACTTLQRQLDHHKRRGTEQFFYNSNKCAVLTVFSTEQEGKLIDYITTVSHME